MILRKFYIIKDSVFSLLETEFFSHFFQEKVTLSPAKDHICFIECKSRDMRLEDVYDRGRRSGKKIWKPFGADHLNVTVQEGQIYGFLGPNGAGKSTTMNIMTGYLTATEGKTMINGYDILKEAEAVKKCIGYMSESQIDGALSRTNSRMAGHTGGCSYNWIYYLDETEEAMIRRKKTLFLGGGIFCILLVLLFFLSSIKFGEEDGVQELIPVTQIDSEKIVKLEFMVNGEEVSFIKSNGAWHREGEDAFPADGDKIQMIADHLSELFAVREIDGEKAGLEEYGLTTPVNQIRLITDDGNQTLINVGNRNESQGITYLYLNEAGNKVYLTEEDVAAELPSDLMDLANGESPPTIAKDNITRIEVNKADGYSLEKDTFKDYWNVRNISENKKESIITLHRAKEEIVNSLTSNIAALTFLELADYKGDDMEGYGLDDPSAILRIYCLEDKTDTSGGGVAEENRTGPEQVTILYVGRKNEEDNYFVRVEGSQQVHTVSGSWIDQFLSITPEDCWSLKVMPLSLENLKGVDVSYQNQTVRIKRKSEEVSNDDGTISNRVSYSQDGKELVQKAVEDFISDALDVEAQNKSMEYTNENEPVFTLTFHSDNGDYVTTYCPYDSSFYYVKDMEGVPSLVNKKRVESLIESYKKLLESQ